MRRATMLATLLVAAAACASPEPAREWPAQHPLRAEARDEAPEPLPSLAPRFDLPAAGEHGVQPGGGAHGAHGQHGGHGGHGGHAGHGQGREVRP